MRLITLTLTKCQQRSLYDFWLGGWRPNNFSSVRIAIIVALFKSKDLIVARPVAVNPTTFTPSQWKCLCQDCWRGLKIFTVSPVSTSLISMRAPFLSEQDTQARAKFSGVVSPPATTGITWSIWKVATCPSCEMPQYSQRSPDLWITNLRRDMGIDDI